MDQARFDILSGVGLLVGATALLGLVGPPTLAAPITLAGYVAPTVAGFLFLAAGFETGPAPPHVLRGLGLIVLGAGFGVGVLIAAGLARLIAVVGAIAAVGTGVATALGYGTRTAPRVR